MTWEPQGDETMMHPVEVAGVNEQHEADVARFVVLAGRDAGTRERADEIAEARRIAQRWGWVTLPGHIWDIEAVLDQMDLDAAEARS